MPNPITLEESIRRWWLRGSRSQEGGRVLMSRAGGDLRSRLDLSRLRLGAGAAGPESDASR
jgi:hypothetical protein